MKERGFPLSMKRVNPRKPCNQSIWGFESNWMKPWESSEKKLPTPLCSLLDQKKGAVPLHGQRSRAGQEQDKDALDRRIPGLKALYIHPTPPSPTKGISSKTSDFLWVTSGWESLYYLMKISEASGCPHNSDFILGLPWVCPAVRKVREERNLINNIAKSRRREGRRWKTGRKDEVKARAYRSAISRDFETDLSSTA